MIRSADGEQLDLRRDRVVMTDHADPDHLTVDHGRPRRQRSCSLDIRGVQLGDPEPLGQVSLQPIDHVRHLLPGDNLHLVVTRRTTRPRQPEPGGQPFDWLRGGQRCDDRGPVAGSCDSMSCRVRAGGDDLMHLAVDEVHPSSSMFSRRATGIWSFSMISRWSGPRAGAVHCSRLESTRFVRSMQARGSVSHTRGRRCRSCRRSSRSMTSISSWSSRVTASRSSSASLTRSRLRVC